MGFKTITGQAPFSLNMADNVTIDKIPILGILLSWHAACF